MVATPSKASISPAELLKMPNSGSYELVDGQIVEKRGSTLSCLVEGVVFSRIFRHSLANHLGLAWTGTMGFQCFASHPDKVRKPDASFVKAERFKPEFLKLGFLPIAPDLAVEVIAPGDLWCELVARIEEYRGAGVSLIWVIDPECEIVDVYRKDGSISRLHEADELMGDDVLPGFRCRVSEFFPVSIPAKGV